MTIFSQMKTWFKNNIQGAILLGTIMSLMDFIVIVIGILEPNYPSIFCGVFGAIISLILVHGAHKRNQIGIWNILAVIKGIIYGLYLSAVLIITIPSSIRDINPNGELGQIPKHHRGKSLLELWGTTFLAN